MRSSSLQRRAAFEAAKLSSSIRNVAILSPENASTMANAPSINLFVAVMRVRR